MVAEYREARPTCRWRYDHPDDAAERRGDLAKAQAFLRDRGHTFPSAITDDADLYEAYRVPGPPVAALIDDRGRLVDWAVSLADARQLMAEAVARVRAEPGGG